MLEKALGIVAPLAGLALLRDVLCNGPGPMDRDTTIDASVEVLAAPVHPVLVASVTCATFSLASTFLGSKSYPGLLRAGKFLCIGWISIWLVVVALGAPLTRCLAHSWLLSLSLASLSVLPLAALNRNPIHALCSPLRNLDPEEWCAVVPCLSTACGAWLGAIPISLDWNRPWQRWPLTPLFGGLLANILGLIYVNMQSKR